jgi:metallo-beta-lactamase family protein
MSSTLQFLGAAGTVTGSKYLFHVDGKQLLLDCGLFQGLKSLRERNWKTPPFDPREIAAVVLSHGHVDHSGYLPLLARNGFHGPVHCTAGTADLLVPLLLDAAHLQEEEAEFANRVGYSKHHPALPLYTTADAEAALRLLKPSPYNTAVAVVPGLRASFHRAGHILGAAIVDLELERLHTRVVFSGDLGRWGRPILRDPDLVPDADVILIESTYGDRTHPPDAEEQLAQVVRDTAARRGVLMVPAFAVGRTQELMWTLRKLEEANRIPVLPVYVDSPMAIDVTAIYCRHPEDHDLDMQALMDQRRCPLCCHQYHLLRSATESKALNHEEGPMIIIAGSGMATGGRILHHLKQRVSDERNTVLLSGFQSAGTRGRSLQEGAQSLRIHGATVAVRAYVAILDGLSAHADRDDLLRWLRGFKRAPRQVFVVHGEPHAADQLAATIRTTFGWNARVPEDREIVSLSE